LLLFHSLDFIDPRYITSHRRSPLTKRSTCEYSGDDKKLITDGPRHLVVVSDIFEDATINVFPEPSNTIEELRVMVEEESGQKISLQELAFFCNGDYILDSKKSLAEARISDGDMLQLQRRPGQSGPPAGWTQQHLDNTVSPADRLRRLVLRDPRLMAELQQKSPELAREVNDPTRFESVWREVTRAQDEQKEMRELEERLARDPFDLQAQQQMEEMIRQKAVVENLETAMEHSPEGTFLCS
jgi:DNA damage-inducible protein 1